MTAQRLITQDAALAFAYIGQFRKRPVLTRCSNVNEETKLAMLAHDIFRYMPEFAGELFASGRKKLERELA